MDLSREFCLRDREVSTPGGFKRQSCIMWRGSRQWFQLQESSSFPSARTVRLQMPERESHNVPGRSKGHKYNDTGDSAERPNQASWDVYSPHSISLSLSSAMKHSLITIISKDCPSSFRTHPIQTMPMAIALIILTREVIDV